MLVIKNFLSTDCVNELLSLIENEDGWKEDLNVPDRLTTDITQYPTLLKELDTKFTGYKLFIDNRIYFSRYVPNTICHKHADPCNYTMIVLLQSAQFGGNFMLVENNTNKRVKMNVGDAVLFKGSTEHFITEIVEGTRIALAIWFDKIHDQLVV